MLNTHNISFYDPYRDRNRNSALEIKKQHILKKERPTTKSRDPSSEFFHVTRMGQSSCVVFFLHASTFFRISLQVKKQVRRNVNPETVMLKKTSMPGSYGFFSFFQTRKKAYYHRKNRTQKVGSPVDLPLPSPQPQRGGGVDCRIDTSTLLPPRFFCIHLFAPPEGVCVFLPR